MCGCGALGALGPDGDAPAAAAAAAVAGSLRRRSGSGLRAASHGHKMLQVLACGAVVFPGLFFALRRLLPAVFRHWSGADVVLVSER